MLHGSGKQWYVPGPPFPRVVKAEQAGLSHRLSRCGLPYRLYIGRGGVGTMSGLVCYRTMEQTVEDCIMKALQRCRQRRGTRG